MADTKTAVAHEPIWIDLSSTDAAGSREFYAKLFGWKVDVNPDPQYGGYALAKLGGKDVAGIGPTQTPEGPSAWMVYVGTKDAGETSEKAASAGGKVVVEPMQVGPQGKMAVIQDPAGAFFGLWEPGMMKGAEVRNAPGAYAWAELNARGFDKAVPFYSKLFGWSQKTSPMGEGQPDYTEFQLHGESVGGGMEMSPMVPAQVPSYWMVYFAVGDVDKAFEKAVAAGGTEMLGPTDFPGGRFAIVQDPQGASFGLMKNNPTQR
jgi:predicted enzyme related to lactoylglutathione lyase